jgi:MFS family permease
MTVIGLQFAWAAIMVAGMMWLPETPRHLCTKGRHEQAKASLARITALSGEVLEQEYQVLREGLEAEEAESSASYLELFGRGEQRMWFRTLTGVLIQACQQLTGINFIFYFGTVFFKSSGISNPFVISIITNVVNVVCTIPGILVIDKVGRRSLLFWPAIMMSICEFIVAAVGMTVGTAPLVLSLAEVD